MLGTQSAIEANRLILNVLQIHKIIYVVVVAMSIVAACSTTVYICMDEQS